MINSVSSVSFKANPAPSMQDIINAPGRYVRQDILPRDEVKVKDERKIIKTIVGLVAAGIAVAGTLLLGAKKGWFKVLDETALGNAKFTEKVGHYLAKAGDFLDTKVWQKMTGLFNKAEKAEVAEKVENVAQAVQA